MLNITQAAASSLLGELEFVLGETLFSRSRSGTRATASGRLLIERARPILNNIRSAVDAVHQTRDGIAGEVRIGTLQAAAMTILPLAISLMQQQPGAVRFYAVEGPARQLVASLLQGDLDLIIGRVPMALISGLLQRTEVLVSERYVVVCRVGHPLASRSRIRLADVVDADWILSEVGSPSTEDFRASFVRASLRPPEPVIVTSSSMLRVSLLEATDMLSVLSQRQARAHGALGVLKVLEVGIQFRDVPTVLLSRADTVPSNATIAFIQRVREAASILKARG
jgi:DNA-binding transcriptional LysR family regulator